MSKRSIKRKPLSELASRIDYGYTASSTPLPVGPKFLRITDIQNGSVDWEAVPFCQIDGTIDDRLSLRPGDIVFARTGATTGKSFLIGECPETAVFASYLIRVRPAHNIDPRYLAHYFQSADYWAQISKQSAGTAQPGVNASKLKELKVPFPSHDVQLQVADLFDKLRSALRQREKSIAELESSAQSIFLQMFGDPAHNPQHWQRKPLSKLAIKMSDGPFGSNLKTSDYTDGGIRVVRLQNIGVGRFVDDDEAFVSDSHFQSLNKHRCDAGDVIVGTLGDPNLRACILPEAIAPALNKADCVQFRIDPKQVTAEYVCWLLNMPSTLAMAQNLILGQTRLRISMGRLKTLEVPVPPLELQVEFGKRMKTCEKLMNSFRESHRLLVDLIEACGVISFPRDGDNIDLVSLRELANV